VIRAVVDRIESGVAVLEFDDATVLMVAAGELPAGTAEGEFVQLRIERIPTYAAESHPGASG
jgi:hypothetical protein